MNIKVGVRVRPFSASEKQLKEPACLSISDQTITLTDPEESRTRQFKFDHCFWSFDGFTESANGRRGTNPHYAEQRDVFLAFGMDLLGSAWSGINSCLFAYGEEGSGKSYSLFGDKHNKGVVQITLEQLFVEIPKRAAMRPEVSISMLAIERERVYDLLGEFTQKPRELKIRESRVLGVYVQGLDHQFVRSVGEAEKLVDLGLRNREKMSLEKFWTNRVATVLTISLEQVEIEQPRCVYSQFATMQFVECVNSQRYSKASLTENRLKEAVSIGRSLNGFGAVISNLADKGRGRHRGIVPYRDSALTRLMQHSLGMNCRTSMLVTLSPSPNQYHQTLSSLRYGDQTRYIVNQPVVNFVNVDTLRERLRREVADIDQLTRLYRTQDVQGQMDSYEERRQQDREWNRAKALETIDRMQIRIREALLEFANKQDRRQQSLYSGQVQKGVRSRGGEQKLTNSLKFPSQPQ